MKVSELIEKLKDIPPDYEVLINDWNEEYAGAIELNAVQVDDEYREVVLDNE